MATLVLATGCDTAPPNASNDTLNDSDSQTPLDDETFNESEILFPSLPASPADSSEPVGIPFRTVDLNWVSQSPLPPADCVPAGAQAVPPTSRLLTRLEYNNTIRSLFGDESEPANNFPPETAALGFANGEAHGPNPLLVESYLSAAEDIADRMVENHFLEIVSCDPEIIGSVNCGDAFIQEWGSKAFRRPLRFEEFLVFKELYLQVFAMWDFETAVELVLQAILQSPQFLYRVELGIPASGDDMLVQLDGYETASRLSYLLWNGPPDDTLLNLAASGALLDIVVLEEQARRLLDDDRAKSTIEDFHTQWLTLDSLDTIVKDDIAYPSFTDSIRASWRQELKLFLEYVFLESEAPLDDFFGSSVSFLNADLATFYEHEGEFPENTFLLTPNAPHRAGILTQPGLLALLSNPDQSSPIRRGVFVREKLLCESLPAPPNDVPIIPPDPDPDATTRERFAAHTEEPSCQGCHVLIDPVGFGFEEYNGVGLWRDIENGIPVDTTGEMLYTDSQDPILEGPFTGVSELSQKLRNSTQVQTCIAKHWFRYSMGRMESTTDSCSIENIESSFIGTGGDVRELLVALIRTDTFRYRSAPHFEETP
jgi:hypothetical protein